jgi:dolichol kinase
VTDLLWIAIWTAVLGAAAGGCLLLRGLGLPSTYVRDLLHVGAGIWVLSWRWWDGDALPVALVATVAIAIAVMPALATRSAIAARFQRSVAEGDERWSGLVLYTLSYATLTVVGLTGDPFPAAAGLLALSLGDGIGGAVGRRFGTVRYRAPWGKTKSLEGSLTVAIMAAVAVMLAARLFDASIAAPAVIAIAAVAAIAEGLAPRASDNALLPAAVWAITEVLT